MARSKIGSRGSNPGPGKTSMAGTGGKSQNLGRSTSVNRSAGTNKDVTTAFKRRGRNAGPGGTQRPPA